MFKKSVLHMAVAIALLATTETILAASDSSYVPVSASVGQNCSISTSSALAFSAYDPVGTNATAALNATGQISVTCSMGAAGMTIGIDNGTHFSGIQRAMMGSAAQSLLQYNIFQPPNNSPSTPCTFPGTTAWTAIGSGQLTLSTSPSNVARVYNVCGTIPGGQDVVADTYTDTVGATINF